MKTLITSLFTLLFSTASFAQTNQKVIAGEYITIYVNDGDAYFTSWNNYTVPSIKKLSLSNIIDGDGGQYTCVLLDAAGKPYIARLNNLTTMLDVTAVNFSGASAVFAIFDGYFAIKGGKIYAFGNDYLNINGGKYISTPILLGGSYKYTKLSAAMSTSLSDIQLSALAENGTVWRYTRGSKNPTQITFPGNTARDITHVGANAFVVETATDLLAWGGRLSYVGLPWNASSPTSIKKQYTDAGATFPTRQLVGNYNTLHLIDAKGDMFGQGDNAMGEVGAGVPYRFTGGKYEWNWQMTKYQPVIKIEVPGNPSAKWQRIYTSNSITFYLYAHDAAGNLYSWGRNKALSLGNGYTLAAFGGYDKAPNYLDMPSPSFVTPLNITWKVITADPAAYPVAKPIAAPMPPVKKPIITITIHGDKKITLFDDYSWSEGDGSMN